MRKVLGYTMITSVFIALIAFLAWAAGWRVALLVWGVAAVGSALLYTGVTLTVEP